jgi:branched-chain amino acid transport system permease protein
MKYDLFSRAFSYIKDKKRGNITVTLLVTAVLALIPLFMDVERSYWIYFLFLTFVNIVIAQGWNLVAGYAGQISLGQNAFFGLGAYTTALLWIHDITKTGYYFDPVVMILSGLVPVVLAIIIGIPLLSRLRGDYFAFGTLGVGQIISVVFVKLRHITGGADGLHIPSTVYSSMSPYYYTGLLMALFATGMVYFITRSRIGLALRAIREDEMSAASHGVWVLQYKVFAFAAGAFLAGLAGSLYGIYLFHINPDSVLNMNWLFYPILMCVLGGTGTIIGPVIGALFMTALFSFGDKYFAQTHPIISGVLIILVMKFMPSGIIGLKDRFSRRK